MPDRGVVADYSWLKGHIPDGELQKIQAAATDRPQVAATWAIQGRNLKKMSDAGVKITRWHRRQHAVGAARGNGGHGRGRHDAGAGDRRRPRATAPSSCGFQNTGTIENGEIADLLILDANPLDDITNTRKINAVYLRGVAVQR